MAQDWAKATPQPVLDFWFPDNGHDRTLEKHRAFWRERMSGGFDEAICNGFADLAAAAARGLLDHWAETPRGRLALVIALDQFSRSVWRDTPGAFGQDIKAAGLVLEGLGNGHYDALPTVWEKNFCLIAMGHCEGPDHLERMDRALGLSRALLDEAPAHLALSYQLAMDQARLAREVIARFGRYPHRNALLGRISTSAEETYVAAGQFPHLRQVPDDREGLERLLARREDPVRGL
jgi:uncharacterized protein (DUF924 family)